MTEAQETLRADIEKIKDDAIIEKIRIFILGILAQQSISEQSRKPPKWYVTSFIDNKINKERK